MDDLTKISEREKPSSGRLETVAASITDAELVEAAKAGDRGAFTTLFERWFDRSYDVAWRIVRNPETAAEVAQETFLGVWEKIDTLRDPEAFGGWVLRSSRNKALNRLDREGRSLAFDTEDTVTMIDLERSAVDVADEIVRQEQHDLVWAAAQALGERDASILDLHLRHDMGPAEIAELLDIAPNAAHQTLFRLRKRLEGAIRSYVLWQDGSPDCEQLAGALDSASVGSFGPKAVKTISAHVAGCEACQRRHSDILAPASMFAAVPLVVVGLDVRQAAAAELASHGVPIDPDSIALHSSPAPEGEPPSSNSPVRKAAFVAIAAGLVLTAGVVVGAGLLDSGEGTEVESIAAPAPTVSGPRGMGAAALATDTAPTAVPPEPEPFTTPSDEPSSTVTTRPAGTTAAPDPVTTATPPSTSRPDPTTTTRSPNDPTTTTSTTVAPAPAPVIVRFSATDTGQACSRLEPDSRVYRLAWLTREVDYVEFRGSLPGPAGDLPPSGQASVCLPVGATGTWVLFGSGPGGTVTAEIQAP